TTQWTVNGVAYEAVDFAIVDIEALTSNGKYIEILFNKPIKSLERSEVSIRETVSQKRAGVESVDLAANGMSAQVTLLGSEEDDNQIMKFNTDYTVSITQDGQVTSGVFQIDAVIEEEYIKEV